MSPFYREEMARNLFSLSRRTSKPVRSSPSLVDTSNINALRPQRSNALLMNGVWLHPTTVTAVSELEQWYDLEFRVPAPPPHEGWPR